MNFGQKLNDLWGNATTQSCMPPSIIDKIENAVLEFWEKDKKKIPVLVLGVQEYQDLNYTLVNSEDINNGLGRITSIKTDDGCEIKIEVVEKSSHIEVKEGPKCLPS